MANGVLVRTLDELKENWDLEKILNYYLNGKLLTWLNDRYYTELAEEVSALNCINDNTELQNKLCSIFGIEVEDDLVDLEAIAERNRRLEVLRQYTADDAVLKNVDKVAFDQEELADLLDEDENVIYLCDNKFSIPLSLKGKKYIGLGDVEIQINGKEYVDFAKLEIELVNVHFNKEYEELVNSNIILYKKGEELEAAEKFVEALEMYKKAGEMGNAEGLFRAGKFYHEGRTGIEVNYELARKYYEQAVRLNNAKAMNNLANMYGNGEGVTRNILKAIELYEKAALLKNVAAMDNLGDKYRWGNGVEQDYLKAKQWYEKAADLGNAYAMYMLGDFYRDGLGVEQNYLKAKEWYEKASDLGSADAMGSLGNLYLNGQGVAENDEEALKWFRKGAEKGAAWVIGNVGHMYQFGCGVPQNYTEAMNWYRKAAEKGNAFSIRRIGDLYCYGRGVEQNYNEALKNYEQAAELGDTYAMNSIGDLYYNGNGVDKNYEEAFKWYKKAENNADANFNLGWLYEFGQGTDKNVDMALSYYKKAVKNGHYNENYKWDSAFRYADILFKSNRENEALEFLANVYDKHKKEKFLEKIDEKIDNLSFPYTGFYIYLSFIGFEGANESDAYKELKVEVQNSLNELYRRIDKEVNESTNKFLDEMLELTNVILIAKSIFGSKISQEFNNIQNLINNEISNIVKQIYIPSASSIADNFVIKKENPPINTGSWLYPRYNFEVEYRGEDISKNAENDFRKKTTELVEKVKAMLHKEIKLH